MDYSIFAPLEKYLLEAVRPRFREQGYLNAFDFFCIVIWKANRAKSKVAKKLLALSRAKDLDSACEQLTRGIHAESSDQEKLELLLNEWRFRLPMASAILSILYPERFTIYDFRVCSQIKGFDNLDSKSIPKKCQEYFRFMETVKGMASEKGTLTEKDRWLWGKSFADDLKRDIDMCFSKKL